MDDIRRFIENSFKRLDLYEKKGRYFHTITPADNSPLVVHRFTNQLTYVISGEGIVSLNGIEKKVQSKDFVFVEAGTTHSFVALSDELTLFHIHIPDEGRDSDRFIVSGDDYERFEM